MVWFATIHEGGQLVATGPWRGQVWCAQVWAAILNSDQNRGFQRDSSTLPGTFDGLTIYWSYMFQRRGNNAEEIGSRCCRHGAHHVHGQCRLLHRSGEGDEEVQGRRNSPDRNHLGPDRASSLQDAVWPRTAGQNGLCREALVGAVPKSARGPRLPRFLLLTPLQPLLSASTKRG